MLALELTDIRDFMNKLLRSEIFDHFLLQEGVITSAASYVIDGHINKGFYSAEELEEIGTKYHLTRERVRQIKEKAIRRLRTSTKNNLLKSYLG